MLRLDRALELLDHHLAIPVDIGPLNPLLNKITEYCDDAGVRACIVNFHTAQADVEAVPLIAVRIGRTVDAQLRPAIS